MTHTAAGERRGRELPDELLPLAPLLYLAWTDGALEPQELALLRHRADSVGHLGAEARVALRGWLDAGDPPTPDELTALLERIRSVALPDGEPSLDTLQQRLAAAAPSADEAARHAALADLDAVLAVPHGEAARALTGTPPPALPAAAAAAFDARALHRFVHAEQSEVRERVLALLATPAFAYVDARDTAAYREHVLHWCQMLADAGLAALAYPREFGGVHDVAASIAAFEAIAHHDLSLLVKYGVQFGLFAGAIYQLGTRTHHERYLRPALTLALPGCFAMTETDHGSNVRDIRTTATYDAAAREFVIDTPEPGARKDYIGNAALHGRAAVVFARLRTLGTDHGVHAFVVPIRDERGAPLPGVHIEDCGLKGGLNGVDNGRIAFQRVRVPRSALLDRFGAVSDGGAYSSPIASPGRRFFTMLGTLVAGRISIGCASVSAAATGLTIAIRYAARRRQFGPEGAPEMPVLDYTDMQLRLLPRLATAYALNFALHDLVTAFASRSDDVQEIETLAAALKACASDFAVETLQVCREACGGQGFLADNRIATLRADADVFTTFEGANPVLYQLVAKGRLTGYRAQFGELRLWHVARHIAGRAAARVAGANPVTARRTDPDHLTDPDFLAGALRYREERLLASLARRLKHRIDRDVDSFDALNQCQDHAIELGRAAAERYALDRFHAAVQRAPAELRPALARLAALYGLDRVATSLAWYLQSGYIEPPKAAAIRNQINELARRVRTEAETLADAFGVPDRLLAAPIARPG